MVSAQLERGLGSKRGQQALDNVSSAIIILRPLSLSRGCPLQVNKQPPTPLFSTDHHHLTPVDNRRN